MNTFPAHIIALLQELGFQPHHIKELTWDYLDRILRSYYGGSERLPNGEWGN